MELNLQPEENHRSASRLPLRERYLLEKERIQRELGDLEVIRHTLGFSQRRLCQLLLVDPSAWTRWLKSGAPPHIYQALSWLVQLKKVNPDAVAPSDLSQRVEALHSVINERIRSLESITEARWREQVERLEAHVFSLKSQLEQLMTKKKRLSHSPMSLAKTKKRKRPKKSSQRRVAESRTTAQRQKKLKKKAGPSSKAEKAMKTAGKITKRAQKVMVKIARAEKKTNNKIKIKAKKVIKKAVKATKKPKARAKK